MSFLWTTIHVSDLERSLAFYRNRLGYQVDRMIAGDTIAFLGTGETKLELITGEASPSPAMSLGFAVTDLDQTRQELADCQPSDIVSPMPGLRFCFVKDPDGYVIQLVEMRQHD